MAGKAAFAFSSSLMALAFLASPASQAQSLKAAIEQTIKNNPDILIDANRRLSIDEAVKGARGGYYPRIDLAAGRGIENSSNITTRQPGVENTLNRSEASLTLTQMLFDGFATKSEVARNVARLESAAAKLAGTSEQTALSAAEAYLEVLRLREIVDLTRDNAAVHQRTYDQIKIRSDSGVGRRADLDQIDARFALARANLVSAEANLRDAEINFERIVGIEATTPARPSEPLLVPLPNTLEEALQLANDYNPILRSAQADISATTAQINAAKSTETPRVDLQVGASKNRNIDGVRGANDDVYAMLRLRYTLSSGGTDTARINETVILSEEAREVMNRTRRQLVQSVRLSWNALVSIRQRLPSLREHASSSALTRDAYTKQFSIGQRTLLDMLDSENESFTAATNYVTGQYLEIFAQYRLLSDQGRLLPALGIAPREESYIRAAPSVRDPQ
jgi:adhesin transport system outer membrane protein